MRLFNKQNCWCLFMIVRAQLEFYQNCHLKIKFMQNPLLPISLKYSNSGKAAKTISWWHPPPLPISRPQPRDVCKQNEQNDITLIVSMLISFKFKTLIKDRVAYLKGFNFPLKMWAGGLDCSLIFNICFNFFERSRCYRKYHFQSLETRVGWPQSRRGCWGCQGGCDHTDQGMLIIHRL